MNIKTIAVTSPGKVEQMTLQTPPLQGREVLVKVHAVALCTLEQRIFAGKVPMPYPCTGGHEVAGEIASLGPDVNSSILKVGGRVSVRMLYNCGECHQCRSGRTNMCEKAQHKPVREGLLPGPGGCSDYVIVSSDALYPIPDALPYEQAALTEPLACVVHSIGRADVALGSDVVVIGGGIMGQFHTMLAKMRGARVIMCELSPQRCALAKVHGADEVVSCGGAGIMSGGCGAVSGGADDAVKAVLELTGGRGAEVVFNTTAVPEVFVQALSMAGKRGTVVQYSGVYPDIPALVSPHMIHSRELNILGSISPKVEDFYTANRLLSSGLVDCSRLVAATFPFARAQEAYEKSLQPGTFRVVLTD